MINARTRGNLALISSTNFVVTLLPFFTYSSSNSLQLSNKFNRPSSLTSQSATNSCDSFLQYLLKKVNERSVTSSQP